MTKKRARYTYLLRCQLRIAGMELTEAQVAALLEKKMPSDADALAAYVAKERPKIHQK